MLFNEIIGLDSIKQSLIQAVRNNHLAHAQLLHAPVGGAGLALALALATYLQCENRQATDACGNCASCIKMTKLIHPDVHFVFPVAKTKKIKDAISDTFLPLWRDIIIKNSPYFTLTDWLEFADADDKQGNIAAEEARNIIKKLSLKAYEGSHKVLILWQAELLNHFSANALLKLLEEPPENTIFLIIANDYEKILPTILSRTQRIGIPNFSDDDVCNYLMQKKNITLAQAQPIAYMTQGNMAQAIKVCQNTENQQHTWFANWMRQCYRASMKDLIMLAEQYDSKHKESQKTTIEYALTMFRELFLWQNNAPFLVRLATDELSFVQNFAKVAPPHTIEKTSHELSKAYFHIERNARAKMVFLDLSLTIARYFREKQ